MADADSGRVCLIHPPHSSMLLHHAPILVRGADLPRRPLPASLSLIINAVQTPLVAQTSSMANRDALDPPTSLARCIDMRGTSSCRIPRPVDEFIVAPMNAWSTRPLRHGRQLYPLLHLLPRDILVLPELPFLTPILPPFCASIDCLHCLLLLLSSLLGRDRKSTRLNSSHSGESRMPSSA